MAASYLLVLGQFLLVAKDSSLGMIFATAILIIFMEFWKIVVGAVCGLSVGLLMGYVAYYIIRPKADNRIECIEEKISNYHYALCLWRDKQRSDDIDTVATFMEHIGKVSALQLILSADVPSTNKVVESTRRLLNDHTIPDKIQQQLKIISSIAPELDTGINGKQAQHQR